MNFVDVFTRKGARVRGQAVLVERGTDDFGALLPRFAEVWAGLSDRINTIVMISVSQVKPLTTPPYDDGATEDEMIALYKSKYAELYP